MRSRRSRWVIAKSRVPIAMATRVVACRRLPPRRRNGSLWTTQVDRRSRSTGRDLGRFHVARVSERSRPAPVPGPQPPYRLGFSGKRSRILRAICCQSSAAAAGAECGDGSAWRIVPSASAAVAVQSRSCSSQRTEKLKSRCSSAAPSRACGPCSQDSSTPRRAPKSRSNGSVVMSQLNPRRR